MQTLPLGIDVGERRVRVALARTRAGDTPELIAVATRPREANLGVTLADAVRELGTRERRCVFGVGEPDAIVRGATFPPMRRGEQQRAAHYEAGRHIDYPLAEAHVRVVPRDARGGEFAIGVVRRSVLADLTAATRQAKLRAVAVDHRAFALHRALPAADAILDAGLHRCMLYVFGGDVPRTHRIEIGGAAFTDAVADALGMDAASAERRKLAHGITGTGDALRDRLVESVALALIDCRADGYGDVRELTLTGNAARLAGLAGAIERATAVRVGLAALDPRASTTLPPDVLRAATVDWAQAYGLSLWAAA